MPHLLVLLLKYFLKLSKINFYLFLDLKKPIKIFCILIKIELYFAINIINFIETIILFFKDI
jgi:hypothetical protein